MNTDTPTTAPGNAPETLGQAIETRYICATNYHGSRIKAQCERGSLTVTYPSDLNSSEAHVYAARLLVEKFVKEDAKKYGTHRNPWSGKMYSGGTKKGYCHVIALA